MKINVTAPINTLGFGVCGLNAVLGLEKVGHEPALWPIGQPDAAGEYHEAIQRALSRAKFYDPNAPSLRIWHQFDLAPHVGKKLHAALTYFEVDKLPANEVHQLKCQDVVFASSAWMRDVLVANGLESQKVQIACPGVDRSIFRPGKSDSKTTTFLSCGKWEIRKGHDALAKAFLKAFEPSDDVELLLLTSNPFLSEDQNKAWAELFTKSKLGNKVRVLNRLPTHRDVAHVMRMADCGVYLSRAEGWNLELAEMLAMGKHCIATNFSAHTQYVDNSNCRLVEIDQQETAYDGIWFHGTGEWARVGDRQIEQAAEHMRSVHKSKQEGTLGVNEAALNSMKQYTWENFAKQIAEGLR